MLFCESPATNDDRTLVALVAILPSLSIYLIPQYLARLSQACRHLFDRITPTLLVHSLLASTSQYTNDVATTALLNAVLLGMPYDVVAILLMRYSADPDYTDNPLLLVHAVERCNIPLIQLVLSITPSDPNIRLSHFHCAILMACVHNYKACFDILASNPPFPTWSTYNKSEALRTASNYNRPSMVSTLLDAGANPLDLDGEAIRVASFDGHLDILIVLIRAVEISHLDVRQRATYVNAVERAFVGASRFGHAGSMEVLLGTRMVDEKTMRTALRHAAERGHVPAVRVILGVMTPRDCDALKVAVMKGHEEIVGELVAAGADVASVEEGDIEVAERVHRAFGMRKLMMEMDWNPNLVRRNGSLIFAARSAATGRCTCGWTGSQMTVFGEGCSRCH
ncbi:ankyrin repeat-containing domain protein [Cladochytrium replicatum]|nr:ankyrin repeat-containing domain protein [Cladochytrium replicatum]